MPNTSFEKLIDDYRYIGEDYSDSLEKYQRRLQREFRKLSDQDGVNKGFVGINYVTIYFLNTSKNEEGKIYHIKVKGRNKSKIEKLITEALNQYISEGRYKREDQPSFRNEWLLLYIRSFMNENDNKNDYWIKPQLFYDIPSEPIRVVDFWMISFCKKKLRDNLVIDFETTSSFWNMLKEGWYESGKTADGRMNYDEFFRRAAAEGNRFLYLFSNSINRLSALKYEGSICRGSMLFIDEGDWSKYEELKTNYVPMIEFVDPIKLDESNYRKVRKLLEMTSDELSLLLNYKGEVFAIGNIKEKCQCKYMKVVFTGFLKWTLQINGKDTLYFENLSPVIPNVNKGICREDRNLIKKTFGEKCDIKRLCEIVDQAVKKKHGTMVVFAENAEDEAKRLEEFSLPIKHVNISDRLVLAVTSIDGAMICDPYGKCFSIGTILDGKTLEKADSSRGARFNSALKYKALQKEKSAKTLIVVVSEDGYIDCISTEA